MSWASSINTKNCFERYSFDQSFAPSPRRQLERSNSSNDVSARRNFSSGPSRAQSASPAPSKRSIFSKLSKSERSNSAPHVITNIGAPVLVSSTNPLVVANKGREFEGCDCMDKSRLAVQVAEVLAEYDEEEEEEDEEFQQVEEEARYMTSLSPPPPALPLPRLPETVQARKGFVPQLQIYHPQPRSHFSMVSVDESNDGDSISRASSPTDTILSRRESDASWYASSMSSTPASELFEYNPYISKVAERGFQNEDEELVAGPLTPASLHDQKQVTALEEYLSDLGFL